MDNLIYFRFSNDASWHTQNIASAALVIYYPFGQLMVLRGVCIGPASNNIAEYIVVINLLSEAVSYRIDLLVVHLDSQLVVSQLKNIYRVRDPYLYRQFFESEGVATIIYLYYLCTHSTI